MKHCPSYWHLCRLSCCLLLVFMKVYRFPLAPVTLHVTLKFGIKYRGIVKTILEGYFKYVLASWSRQKHLGGDIIIISVIIPYQVLLYNWWAKICPEWTTWKMPYSHPYGIKLGFQGYKWLMGQGVHVSQALGGIMSALGCIQNSSTSKQEPNAQLFPSQKHSLATSITVPKGSHCTSLWQQLLCYT